MLQHQFCDEIRIRLNEESCPLKVKFDIISDKSFWLKFESDFKKSLLSIKNVKYIFIVKLD